MKNQYEFCVYYTSDSEAMAFNDIFDCVKACEEIALVRLDILHSNRTCRNAYGKEMDEDEFDDIDPDSDEAWFDDYDFEFELVIETDLSEEDAMSLLANSGIDVDYFNEE